MMSFKNYEQFNCYTILFSLVSLLFGIFLLIFVNEKSSSLLLKKIALNISFVPFVASLFLWGSFGNSIGQLQQTSKLIWIPILNLNVTTGVDGISIFFLMLSTFLVPICLLLNWNLKLKHLKIKLICFLFVEFLLVGTFCVLDVLAFYIFFESLLIPMFLIIGIWGSRERKVFASYYFFFYTLSSSIFMLLSIVYIYYQTGTTDYETLLTFKLSCNEQKIIWLTFFFAFSSKIPTIPLHLWLPEAHVEAPTAGSVLLAGIMLKLGVYGFARFSLPLLPAGSFFFTPLVYTTSLISVIYASLTATRQTDFKRVIAYASIAHMNVVVIGLFSFNTIGIEGALVQSLSHGFVASGLFALIGIIYERHQTRLIKYYGGLVHVMPLYVSVFLVFSLANIGFPGTSGFVGEFLIFTGSFAANAGVTMGSAFSMVLGGCYSLWLFNKVSFGNLKTQYLSKTSDLSEREIFVVAPLLVYTFILGISPNVCLNSLTMSVDYLVEIIYF